MHHLTRITYFFLALLAVTVCAMDVDAALHRRQNVPIGTGASASSAASTSSATTPSSIASFSNTPESTPTPSTSSAVPSSTVVSTSQTATSAGTEATTTQSSSPSSTQAPSSTFTAASTSIASTTSAQRSSTSIASSQQASVTSTQSVSSRVVQVVTTVLTVSGSSTFSRVLTTSGVEVITPTSTTAPSLDPGNEGSGSSGPASSQKRIIIGVVVGVGGAIVLGGLALVAWRVWGRRKTTTDDDDDLIGTGLGSGAHEKTSTATDNSPFRSTLDQYHNPTGTVNTASNF